MGHGGQKVRAGDREAQTPRRAVEVGQGKRHTSRHGELKTPHGRGREGLGEGVGMHMPVNSVAGPLSV